MEELEASRQETLTKLEEAAKEVQEKEGELVILGEEVDDLTNELKNVSMTP